MNYQAHYDWLIERASNRVLDGYVERHHILPKCLGGNDARSNIVQLTAAEHYVAHQLLAKLHPGVKGLMFALIAMCGDAHGGRSANKAYAWVRSRVAEAQGGVSKARWTDQAYRVKQRAAMAVVMDTPEYKAKLSVAHKGREKSAEERANIAAAGRQRAPRKFSEQAKANMAAARLRTWEERRAAGTHLEIGAKTAAARRANGSYSRKREALIPTS